VGVVAWGVVVGGAAGAAVVVVLGAAVAVGVLVALGSAVGAAGAAVVVVLGALVGAGGAAVTGGAALGLGATLDAAELVDGGELVGALLGAPDALGAAVTGGAALAVLEVALGALGVGAGELMTGALVIAGAGLFGARRARPTAIAARTSPPVTAIHPRRREGVRLLLAGSRAGCTVGRAVGVGGASVILSSAGEVVSDSSASFGGAGPTPPFRMLGCVIWRRVSSAAVLGFAAGVLSRILPVGMRGEGPAAGAAPST
jgi:hypothetical protein